MLLAAAEVPEYDLGADLPSEPVDEADRLLAASPELESEAECENVIRKVTEECGMAPPTRVRGTTTLDLAPECATPIHCRQGQVTSSRGGVAAATSEPLPGGGPPLLGRNFFHSRGSLGGGQTSVKTS